MYMIKFIFAYQTEMCCIQNCGTPSSNASEIVIKLSDGLHTVSPPGEYNNTSACSFLEEEEEEKLEK